MPWSKLQICTKLFIDQGHLNSAFTFMCSPSYGIVLARRERKELKNFRFCSVKDLIVRVGTRGFHWTKRVVLKRRSSQEIQRNAWTWFPNWQVLHPDVCSYVCFLNKIVIWKTKSAREGYTLLCCWYWFIHLHEILDI